MKKRNKIILKKKEQELFNIYEKRKIKTTIKVKFE